MEGGMTCIKYLLFGFNLVFVLVGLGMITCGAVIQAHFHEYFDIIGGPFNAAAALLIVVGCIILIIAFFGCCGAVKENHCMVMTFGALLVIIFVMEVAAGIVAFSMQDEVEDVVKSGLKKSLNKYVNATGARKAWDAMQRNFKCCGVDNGPSDWDGKLQGSEYPKSCCRKGEEDKPECGQAPGIAFQQACVPRLKGFLENEILWIGIVGLVMACVQIVGIVFACCLAKTIRQGYETVK